jgi:predicted nucleic acid-binding protein
MSVKKAELIYWDTYIFFAFLKEEKIKTDRKKEIAILIDKAEKKELVIATSAITLTEAFRLNDIPLEEGLEKIQSFLKHEYIQIRNVDRAIGFRTQRLRQKYFDKMDFEDSIHIATASEYKIKWFLTYDGEERPKNRSKARRWLIPLDKEIETKGGEKIRILTPGDFMKEKYPLPLLDSIDDQAE